MKLVNSRLLQQLSSNINIYFQMTTHIELLSYLLDCPVKSKSVKKQLELLIFQFSAHSISGSDLLGQVTGSEVTGHNYALCVCVTRAHPNAGVAIVGDFNRLPDGHLRNYPLRQVVRDTTRNNAVLDKIFTNVSDWYNAPVILPQIRSSDHRTVLIQPTGRGVRSQPSTRSTLFVVMTLTVKRS